MKQVSIILVMLLLGIAVLAQAPQYSTIFPLTENPISEGGKWINGKAAGLDWNDVQTTPGLAFGTALSTTYSDPTAVMAGSWTADQQVQATVKLNTTFTSCCHEVELRLRTTITPHSITGYEINCNLDNGAYIQIVRWNGPTGNFSYVNTMSDTCKNGDVLKATMKGSLITVFKNGVQILTGTDATFINGAPGIGFYDDRNDSQWNQFGFSAFSAQNLGSTSAPAPPTNLISGIAPPANPLTITTSSLPSATVGQSYSATMTASGGTPPYTWSATGLPAWLSMSTAGILSGTPTVAAAAISFVVTVIDSRNASAREVIR